MPAQQHATSQTGTPVRFGGTKSPHGFFGMAMRRLEQVTVGRRTRAGSIERSNSDALDRCENNPFQWIRPVQSSKSKAQEKLPNAKPQEPIRHGARQSKT